jgi:rare lipoprotein A
MTRPTMTLRARGATMALGALCCATSLGASSGVAHSKPTPKTRFVLAHDRLDVLAGHCATVAGRVRGQAAGRRVLLQRRGADGWRTLRRTTTGAGSAFSFRFRQPRPDSAQLRLVAGPLVRELGRLNVYRHAAVSWYGPGLYGNKLGCGGRLTPATLGVAHKTLPCGARVTLRRGDRVVRVRVVDRGPYVGGREFDLTAATRARLRFDGVGSVLVAS